MDKKWIIIVLAWLFVIGLSLFFIGQFFAITVTT